MQAYIAKKVFVIFVDIFLTNIAWFFRGSRVDGVEREVALVFN